MKKLLLIILCLPLIAQAQVDLQKPFKECGIPGSITLYDYQQKKWIFSDPKDAQYATLPASTFKIINTLIALETKTAKDENHIVKWPGSTDTVKYGYRPSIYHDISMKEAFQKSAGWAYVEMAKIIGKKTYRRYLKKCSYGNVNLSQKDADFWNFGPFAISPKNQVEVLKAIYEETLPFSKRNYQILKKIMVVEKGKNYVIRAKTGWTRDGGKDTGWWVGYVTKGQNLKEEEKNKEVYFFATRLIKPRSIKNKRFGRCRKTITKQVLKQLGVIE
ncbi:MAG TPA: penicillin binding protein transpeptidase domain-containing protein [Microscillaceae bacterium]|nr:penicillin binding protein transpeptidase domain-containing protein [Microscillaceae bacterium]